jgi:hypothetical protein
MHCRSSVIVASCLLLLTGCNPLQETANVIDPGFVGAIVHLNPIVVQIAEDPTQVTCTPAP